MTSIANLTFNDLANILKKKEFATDVKNLGLQGKEITAKSVEEAFVDTAKEGTSKNPNEIITQVRSELLEFMATYRLPKESSLEDVLRTAKRTTVEPIRVNVDELQTKAGKTDELLRLEKKPTVEPIKINVDEFLRASEKFKKNLK